MSKEYNNDIITTRDIKNQGNKYKFYDDFYVVSDEGDIYFRTNNQKGDEEYVKKAVKEGRYYTVTIHQKRKYVHRIVAELFCSGQDTVENEQLKNTVDHKDGCRYNNKSENLEWVSQGENNKRYEEKAG